MVSGLGVAAAAPSVGATSAPTSPPAAATTAGADLPTPLMGFNDWNSFGCNVSEKLIKATADLFVTQGYKDAGYNYVNIDDCWMTKQRDPATNRLVADPVKFPSGMKAVADYVHSKGLKIGIYESAGTKTCAGYPGSLGYESTDAQTFADWGYDLLKYDNCNHLGDTTQAQYITRYKKMGDALKATGRPIVYSLCEWGNLEPWTWAKDKVGAPMWRTTGDISDSWSSMLSILTSNAKLDTFAGPGGWNDPDMLEVGNGGMTDTEYRTHFSMWSIMAAPLIIGSDLRTESPETRDILLNKDVIAIDQDAKGVQGKEIENAGGRHVFVKPLANGDVAVALLNETDAPALIDTTAAAAGLTGHPSYYLKDLWSKETTQTTGVISSSVPAHGTVLYRVSPAGSKVYPPQTTLSGSAPTAYPDGPSLVKPGQTVVVTTTFTNHGTQKVTNASTGLSAPGGWSVRPVGKTRTATVKPGGTSVVTWAVTAPSTLRPGTTSLSATTTYLLKDGRQVSTAGGTALQYAVPIGTGTVALGGASWVSTSNAWGPVERNTSNGEDAAGDGSTITIQGKTFAEGIGTNAPSEVTMFLDGACTSVTANVGLDDETGEKGNAAGFEIWADGVKVASTDMTSADPARTLTAQVPHAAFVTLRATDGGDGANYDHADWGGATASCG
ncbi:hypothetical protein VV02_19070 [Luteipulveratus mongoliensis]|uniref:Alpha-galactosidase n=2 Tax=Luteipulveratus mongoliensis TaxID=571913 RepID=A0A0K1JLK2_9MICO|nr:hypothetical protein VV02_19070 [Luteipulveratus mongoliensis]